MKLKLAVPNQDLAYWFGIHITKVSKMFHQWIDIMSREMKQFVCWPDHELIQQTLPECFNPRYRHTTCIIDCSEVFIERPTSVLAQSQTYSNYKGHNTVKFLIAISPTGAIIFVSKCWGGRVSDKYLTSQSGFLDHLVPGDMVLVDRGFDIADELALYSASLAIPPFTIGKISCPRGRWRPLGLCPEWEFMWNVQLEGWNISKFYSQLFQYHWLNDHMKPSMQLLTRFL